MPEIKLDMAEPKPSFWSFVLITLMASLGIVLLKMIFNRWQVPGVTDFVNAI